MPLDGEKVVDGDGHVFEPPDLWTKRMNPAKWGDWIPHTDPLTQRRYVGGEIRSGGVDALNRAAELSGVPVSKITENVKVVGESLDRLGANDPKTRLGDMDEAGIDASVLYPSSALFFGPQDPISALRNVEFVHDCQRAYNQWLSEFCGGGSGRLFGMGLVPLQDVNLAVKEAEHVVELGLRGVIIRPSAYVDELPFSHRVYDPFWTACQDLDLPVALHPAVHADTPGACRKFGLVVDDADITVVSNTVSAVYGGSGMGQSIGNAVDMIVTVGRLIMGGVCERFPRLRFIFLGSGGGWMPTILGRMDEQAEAFPLEGDHLSMGPSEYFRRQCYVSFDPGEWNLAASASWLGTDRVIWGSESARPDHSDEVVSDLMKALSSLEAPDRRRILNLNGIEAYGLPMGATV